MFVWVTDWQVAEDHVLIKPDDFVDWTVYPADTNWVTRLFGHRLVVEWQFDTYGDAEHQPARQVRGHVTNLRSVRCRQIRTDEGIVPVPGAAILQPVSDTSSSWVPDAKPPSITTGSVEKQLFGWRSYSSILSEGDAEYLYGYVVTVTDEPSDSAMPYSLRAQASAR